MKNHFKQKVRSEQVQEEEQMFVKADHKLIRVLFKDILYIEGWKDYVKIHLLGQSHHPIIDEHERIGRNLTICKVHTNTSLIHHSEKQN